MFGRRPKQKINLVSAIETVLAGGSTLHAADLTVSAGEGGGCVISGSGNDPALIAIQFDSLIKFGATYQPALRARLVVFTAPGGGRQKTRYGRTTFTLVQEFQEWCNAQASGPRRIRWRIHLTP